MFKLVDRKQIESEKWDAFVDGSDEAWLTHRYQFQEAFDLWWDRTDKSFCVVDPDQNNELVAVVPVHLTKERFAKFLKRMILDSHGGIACKNDLQKKYKKRLLDFIVQNLKKMASDQGAGELSFSVNPLAPGFRGDKSPRVNPLLFIGCENLPSNNWMVDCRVGSEKLWDKMEGRARTAIRKAEKEGIVVRPATQPGDIDIYYDLHVQTYNRTGARPHPKEYFEKIFTDFQAHGLAQIFLAEKNGKVIAAENFSTYKKAAEYWTGAANHEGLTTGANTLIQWTAMKWMVDNGIEWYNCGQAFPDIQRGKLKGLNDFKKSFGGDLFPFYKGRLLQGFWINLFYSYMLIRRNVGGSSYD